MDLGQILDESKVGIITSGTALTVSNHFIRKICQICRSIF